MNQKAAGLWVGDHTVPLEHVAVRARVRGLCSAVRVTQRFRNVEPGDAIEAVYVFPLSEGAAVCGFSARVGDRVIEGEVEERERAFARYDDALERGDGAVLLEQERPDVFTTSVGGLRPGNVVEVAIEYVSLLAHEGDAVRLALPSTVAPRYAPASPHKEVGQRAAERVQPPTRAEVPYGMDLRVDVTGLGRLKALESPTHPVRVALEVDGATVALTTDDAALDRDFVLLVEPAEPHRPHALVAREPDGAAVALVTFVPELEYDHVPASEVLFVLDCSGSMAGDSITQARRALAECVRTLASTDTFNVVLFGSTHRPLWPTPRAVGRESLAEALDFLERAGADLGGTELLAPLRFLFERPPAKGRTRQVLLLTDGQVTNESDVIALCEAQRDTRMFVFAIGAAPSEHLARELARVSGGAAEFITGGERIEPKVARMFTRVHAPTVDVALEWGDDVTVEQEPARCPALFSGDTLALLGRITHGTPVSVTLRAASESWSVPLDLDRAEPGGPIPILWARERIRALERARAVHRGGEQGTHEPRRIEAAIVDLARRYRLASSQTSFVAVETRGEGEKCRYAPRLRAVPVAAPAGHAAPGASSSRRSIPQELHASEFFGYTRGSFTGAVTDQPGVLDAAARGTLFIYGIERILAGVLRQLLRAIVSGESARVGGRKLRPVDVLAVLSTTADQAAALVPELQRSFGVEVVAVPAPGAPRALAELLGFAAGAPGLTPDEARLLQTIERLAAGSAPVLVVGSRVDAEAVARRLHTLSRRVGTFVAMDFAWSTTPDPRPGAPP